VGILKEPARFIADLRLRKGFSVCELGNQMMAGGEKGRPAEAFYRALGCERYVSIDANGEGTYTHDLNTPVHLIRHCAKRDEILEFDLVTDFGTGEHIFDQAQVWRTLHDLTRPGGYIAFDRPSEGYAKHCFYLITETLLQDIRRANNYEQIRLARKETPRGWLIRGVFRKHPTAEPFHIPQQHRYVPTLRLGRRPA
jgi:hypothetical protein